jgi:hypothetical protein
VTIDEHGRIDTIVHEDIAEETTAVQAFMKRVGVAL